MNKSGYTLRKPEESNRDEVTALYVALLAPSVTVSRSPMIARMSVFILSFIASNSLSISYFLCTRCTAFQMQLMLSTSYISIIVLRDRSQRCRCGCFPCESVNLSNRDIKRRITPGFLPSEIVELESVQRFFKCCGGFAAYADFRVVRVARAKIHRAKHNPKTIIISSPGGFLVYPLEGIAAICERVFFHSSSLSSPSWGFG